MDRDTKLICLPSINTLVAKEETSSGLPSQITRSAVFPTSMVPKSERPKTSAILAVNAFIASFSGNPCATAFPAPCRLKYELWVFCEVIYMLTPALFSRYALSLLAAIESNEPGILSIGSKITGISSSAKISAILQASLAP